MAGGSLAAAGRQLRTRGQRQTRLTRQTQQPRQQLQAGSCVDPGSRVAGCHRCPVPTAHAATIMSGLRLSTEYGSCCPAVNAEEHMACNVNAGFVQRELQVQRPLAGSEASGRLRRQHAASCSLLRWTTAAMKTQALVPKRIVGRTMVQQTQATAAAVTSRQSLHSTMAVPTKTAEGCSLAGTLFSADPFVRSKHVYRRLVARVRPHDFCPGIQRRCTDCWLCCYNRPGKQGRDVWLLEAHCW